MTQAEQRLADPTGLPVAQRLNAKLQAAAQSLAGLAAREGVEGAAEAGRRMGLRLAALAASAEGTGPDALDRLALAWSLSRQGLLRALVAALPAIDADAAALVAALGGGGEPTCRLEVLEALFPGTGASLWRQRLDCDDPFLVTGLLRLGSGTETPDRRLGPGPGFWPGVLGLPVWPAGLRPMTLEAAPITCAESPDARLATQALAQGEPCLVAVLDDSGEAGLERALALALAADRRFAVFDLAGAGSQDLAAILGHCLLRGCCPILVLPRDAAAARLALPDADLYPAPVLAVARDLAGIDFGTRGLIAPVLDGGWNSVQQAAAWRELAPGLDAAALQPFLARYPLGPVAARAVAGDAARRARLAGRAMAGGDLVAAAAARGMRLSLACAERREPRAGWGDLILPDGVLADLRAMVRRILDRPSAAALLPRGTLPAGQRLLFAGGPGTGKTLAAEVVARETGSALIVADTARLLSKWLGETERNLADLFRAAEESHAVLFFDEADAIFGKRVETQEARDRYANVETAYLLQRIERFSGLVILATNLPGNLDDAFRRRFDAVIDFPQPEAEERAALWRRHLPTALVAGADPIDLERLADWFALPGGLIRNASVSAAYLAAAEGAVPALRHLHRAIAREYLKNGSHFPGLPEAISDFQQEEQLDHG